MNIVEKSSAGVMLSLKAGRIGVRLCKAGRRGVFAVADVRVLLHLLTFTPTCVKSLSNSTVNADGPGARGPPCDPSRSQFSLSAIT